MKANYGKLWQTCLNWVSVQNSSKSPHAQLCESSVEQALLDTETGGTRIAKPQKTWNKRCIVAIAVWLWSGHEKTTWKLIQQPRKELQKWVWDSMGMNATCVVSMAICLLNGAIFDLLPVKKHHTAAHHNSSLLRHGSAMPWILMVMFRASLASFSLTYLTWFWLPNTHFMPGSRFD